METETVKLIIISTLFVSVTSSSIFLYLLAAANTKKNNESNDSQIPALILEITNLYKLVDESIKNDVTVIKSEIKQIKRVVSDAAEVISVNFFDLSDQASKQQQLVNSLIDAINKEGHKNTIAVINETTQKIKDCGSAAVRSLQFEDIVGQVADNGIQYANDIENFLEELNVLLTQYLSSLKVTDSKMYPDITIANVVKTIGNKRSFPDRKAVHQQDMTEGDIELF